MEDQSFYEIGKQYVLRTVTMIYVGTIKRETSTYFILKDAAWIAETSRWNQFVKGELPREMEPYADDVIVYKGAMLDATRPKIDFKIQVI